MGNARYVGRIGALAVALGVSALAPAVAAADPADVTGDSGTSADTDAPADVAGDTFGETEPDGDEQPAADPVPSVRPESLGDLAIARVDSSREADSGDDAEVGDDADQPVAGRHRAKRPDVSAKSGSEFVPRDDVSASEPPSDQFGPSPVSPTTVASPTRDAQPPAGPSDATASVASAVAPAVAQVAPVQFTQTPSAGTPVYESVLRVFGLLPPEPKLPLANPVVESLWGLFRRTERPLLGGPSNQLQHTLFNATPTLAPQNLNVTLAKNQTSAPMVLGGNDADGDTVSYVQPAAGSVGGTLEISGGSATYTPPSSWDGTTAITETFTVAASDDGGFHLHGLPGLLHVLSLGLVGEAGHTATSTLTVHVTPKSVPTPDTTGTAADRAFWVNERGVGFSVGSLGALEDQARLEEALQEASDQGFTVIRTWGTDEYTGRILEAIDRKNLPLRVQAGIYITDADTAHQQIDDALAIIEPYQNHVVGVSLGNEQLVDWNSSATLTVPEVTEQVRYFKSQSDIPVTYDFAGETFLPGASQWDDGLPELIAELDYVSVHSYGGFFDNRNNPAWTPERQLTSVKSYEQMLDDRFTALGMGDKPIILGETGWQSTGYNPVVTNPTNMQKYYELVTRYVYGPDARFDGMYYFNFTDEAWKGGDDHWGLFGEGTTTSIGTSKFPIKPVPEILDGGAPTTPPLRVVEDDGSVALLVDPATGVAYVQAAGSPPVVVTRSDSYWTGQVPLSRGGATMLAAARDSSGRLRVLDTSSSGQYGWILDSGGKFVGEDKYTAATLPGAETLFTVDANGDGRIGPTPDGQPPVTTGSFPVSLVNATGGAYRDDQIFVTFLGQTSPGTWSWIDADGQAHALDHTAANAPGHLVKNRENFADMSFTLAEADDLTIPPSVQAGRMYVSVGEPLYIRISSDDKGWAGPNPTDTTDPNYRTVFDWYELTYSYGHTAFGGNTTQVDQFGLPIKVTLEQGGSSQTRGIALTGDQVFARYAQTVPPAFRALVVRDVAGKPLRIVAPRTSRPGELATWMDKPVDDFWTKYKGETFTYNGPGYTVTGRVNANDQFAYTVTSGGESTAYTMRKPTTKEVFANDGPFVGSGRQGAFLADFSAAFNRGVANTPSQWNNAAAYYPAGTKSNAYAEFFHDISADHYAYGFPYDDTNSQSSVQILGNSQPPARLTISVLAGGSPAQPPGESTGVDPSRWTLTWADEFNVPHAQPDPSKWSYDLGGGGFGNSELQYYTNRAENVSNDADGNLVITARKETLPGTGCWYGTCQYTSGRILTKDKFTQEYGRFEANVKLPEGQGMWPAFWMQGDATGSAGTGWPARGELDIMENIGREPSTVHGSLHGPGYSGGNAITGSYTLPAGEKFSDDFHVFAVEWEPDEIRWYVDDVLYETRTRDDLPAGSPWVFDHPYYLILNSAVGGVWPGSPNASTVFPQKMLIDYVRVYEPANTPKPDSLSE